MVKVCVAVLACLKVTYSVSDMVLLAGPALSIFLLRKSTPVHRTGRVTEKMVVPCTTRSLSNIEKANLPYPIAGFLAVRLVGTVCETGFQSSSACSSLV